MNCNSVESRLSAYIDSELTGSEMQAVRSHLSICSACQTEETQLRILKQRLSQWVEVDVPDDLEAKLMATCHRVETQKPSTAFWLHNSALFVAVASVAMAATVFALSVINHRSPTETQMVQPTDLRSGISIEVQRDRILSSLSDPISGVPVLAAPSPH